MWGLINSMQIIVLTVLFSLIMPAHVDAYLVQIMKLTNMDIIPVDDYLQDMFDFSETESFNDKFKAAGYEGANFVLLTGPFLLIAFAFICFIPIKLLMTWTLSKFSGNFLINRLRKPWNYKEIIMRYVLEGSIDFGLASLIAIYKMNKQSWTGAPQLISSILCIFVLCILVYSPIQLFHYVKKYHKDPEKYSHKYGKLFDGLQSKEKSQLAFSNIVILRRYVMVTVMILMPDFANG